MEQTNKYIFFGLCFLILGGCQRTNQEFHLLDHPTENGSMFPHLFRSGETMYMSWMNTNPDSNSEVSLQFASYENGRWSSVDTIARSNSWFVNWADFPSIIGDSDGPIAAHWLNKKPGGTYAYDVNISFLDGQSWTIPLTPHSDSTATEHGFVSMIPWDQNSILAVWLDGRHSADREEDEYFDLNYAMTLRGALISKSGQIEKEFLIDNAVCDCCSTALIKTSNGALVAYRNRTNDEIRDIYISRFDGKSWSKGAIVHDDGWEIGACPVNGPALAVKDSLVAVAWPTAADHRPKVKAALSTDGGTTFSSPVVISKNRSLGRVDIDIAAHKAYVSWLEKDDHLAALNLRRIGFDGQLSKIFTADRINSSRKTGFPQMEITGEEIILAWTAGADSSSSIKMIKKGLPLFPE